MLKTKIYPTLFFVLILSSSLYSQYYGRVLSLDNNRGVRWEDIGTILANYSTYHPETSIPAWLTTGNTLSAGDFFGSTNNMPLIIKTNNIEQTRITTKGQIEVLNSALSVFLGEDAGVNKGILPNRNVCSIGCEARLSNTTDSDNASISDNALNQTFFYQVIFFLIIIKKV